jgi:hypothetical protein
MISDKERILSQFEPDIAPKLLEFAEFISNHESDVFVFMSRKFCCLYDILLSIGATPVQIPIVSDKLLDIETDFFTDKIVTIVDDIVICGTTLWKAKDKLINYYGAKEVRTFVFCVNEKYWVRECIEPEYKAIVLSEDRSLTFCSSVVNALSIAPRPYAVEFPYLLEIEIKKKYWQQILSSKDWNVYDITNKLQEDNSICVLTFFPSVTMLDEIGKVFGECAKNLTDIIKVRAYAKKVSWGIKMSIIPIVTFKALTKESIDVLFSNFLEILGVQGFSNSNDLFDEFKSPVSRLRIIQYAAALVVGTKYKFNLERTLDKKLNFQLRDLDVELLFGKWHLPWIKALSKFYFEVEDRLFLNVVGIEEAILSLEETELNALMNDGDLLIDSALSQEDDDFPKDDPRNIFSDFSNIFLSLYHKKEIPSRLEVKEAAPKGDWERIKRIDRLETGITWMGILKYLKNIFHYELTPEVKNVLSLVLDYSVDKGICVPVSRYNLEGNILFRAYRHGEDVKFAEEETELCGMAIENAQHVINKGEIPKLFLEKLLVLLIKIGVSKNILQIQYGTTGQEGIAKIGFYLHGAVVKLKKRSSYNAESNIWLSRHLLEKRVIRKSSKGMYAFYEHYPAIQISSTSRTESQKFGYILGLLYKGYSSNGATTRLNDDDLIFLSTCFRPRDVAAALLVELDLFVADLLPILNSIVNQFEVKRINRIEAHELIIKNIGFTALNSLHKKTRGWLEEGARKAIKKGEDILKNLNQFTTKLDWEGYWASLEILVREDEEKVFRDYIMQMSCLGHHALFYENLLEVVLLHDKQTNFQNNTKLQMSVEKLKGFSKRTVEVKSDLLSINEYRLVENLQKQIESGFESFDELKTVKYIKNKLSEVSFELSKLIPKVGGLLDEFEQTGDQTISYDYVIYYDIVDSTANKMAKLGNDIESYRNQVKRTKSSINSFVSIMEKKAREEREEIYCWNGDEASTNDAKYVFFSSAKSGFSLRRVREFVDRLYELSNSDISFRMIICPANAFYSHVFKRFQRTEVEGELFWEHFSRIQKKFGELELKNPSHRNLVLFVRNEFTSVDEEKFSLKQKLWSGEIETSIAASYIKTYGELWANG